MHSEPAPAASCAPQVLLVCPDSQRAETAMRTLSSLGIGYEWVPDIASARIVHDRLRPDALLMQWPGARSWNRLDGEWPTVHGAMTPVYLLVDSSSPTARAEAPRADVAGVLEDPLRADALALLAGWLHAQRSMRVELARTQQQLEILEDGAQIGSWSYDPESTEFQFSPGACRALGLGGGMASVDLAAVLEILDESHRGDLPLWLDLAASGHHGPPLDIQRLTGGRPSASLRWGMSRTGRITKGWVQRLIESGDSADRCEVDAHTGLPDRAQFSDLLRTRVTRAVLRGRKIAVLCLRLQSQRGEEVIPSMVLANMAKRARKTLRENDTLARVSNRSSGDVGIGSMASDCLGIEVELDRAHDAAAVARRLAEVLTQPMSVDGRDWQVRTGIGISVFPDDAQEVDYLLSFAEEASAHASARHDSAAIEFYSPSLNTTSFQKLSMERSLGQALELGQLMVYYQPRVEIASGRVAGFEALVRWKHPEMGMISPVQFIPLAEESGLIVPIGRWVLEQACLQAARWRKSSLPPVRISVNLSLAQFREPNLSEQVLGALKAADLPADALELELTESMLMSDRDSAIAVLRRLKGHGIHMAIDDFGTGYSSLSHLRRFPIDSLKIDQSFVREINTNPDDAAIATSIILMGRSLKLKVVAEGVETRSQLAFLRVMQCDEAQGYLFSPPVPEREATAYLVKGTGRAAA